MQTNTVGRVEERADAERFVGRCKGCKRGHAVASVARVYRWEGQAHVTFKTAHGVEIKQSVHTQGPRVDCPCGRPVSMHPVRGTYNRDKKCGARCLAATGHDCECACGGKNHGAGHEVHT